MILYYIIANVQLQLINAAFMYIFKKKSCLVFKQDQGNRF